MLRDCSGMALVLTMLVVSFLVAVTVQLGASVNWQMQAAANQGNIVQLDAMLLSGLHLARAALLADQQENDFDSALDSWGEFEPETLAGIFGNGRMGIKVTDLSGLLQVNDLVLTDERKRSLVEEAKNKNQGKPLSPTEINELVNNYKQVRRDLWNRFLLSENAAVEDEDTAAGMLDSLADWLDKDDEERENGAERGYYSSLNPSYVPANRPIMFPEELLLVKGWNKQLLYGEKEDSGIIHYLTITGQDGKININTAPPQVLQALNSEITDEFVADLIDFRSNEENRDMLAQPGWYKQVSGFPGDITFEEDMITTSSSYFLVTITARIDGLQRTGKGVVHRNKENNEQELLYWKVE